jgi:hypothetical protein
MMRVEVAIVVVAMAVLYVACMDLFDRGPGRANPAERRTALCRVGGGVVVASLTLMGADWVAEQAVETVNGAAASSGWLTGSFMVVEQLLRLIGGLAGIG